MIAPLIQPLKRLSSALPLRTQQRLKRAHFAHQIRSGAFASPEPEFKELGGWVHAGDWVVDVGANVGHYTAALSRLVGAGGRVLAFEPVPETFELLTANMAVVGLRNVSLFNAAVSDRTATAAMSLPRLHSGLTNYYRAALTSSADDWSVLTLAIDNVPPPKPVTLIKMDVEGHELRALMGMRKLLERDHPRLIIEGSSDEVERFLGEIGYGYTELPDSPNRVFSARK